jgi:hypothetical protein
MRFGHEHLDLLTRRQLLAHSGGGRLFGVPDPRSSGLGNWRDDTEGLTFAELRTWIADELCEMGTRANTLLVHDAKRSEPSLAFELGQWATPVPVSAKRRTSSPFRCTQWASQTSSPSQPSSSTYRSGRIPYCSRQNSSSSRVSARCVCSRTPRERASSAVSAMSSRVTENGDVGARAMRTIAPGPGSWWLSIAAAAAVSLGDPPLTPDSWPSWISREFPTPQLPLAPIFVGLPSSTH